MSNSFKKTTRENLDAIKKSFIQFLDKPTLINLEKLNKYEKDYINDWIQLDDEQKSFIMNEIKELFKNVVPKPKNSLDIQAEQINKGAKNIEETYQRTYNARNKILKFKKEDWSDIQKFAFLLSRLSRIYFRNSEQYGGYKVQSDNDSSQKLYNNKLSLTTKNTHIPSSAFEQLKFENTNNSVFMKGVQKVTHFINKYQRIEITTENSDQTISKFQNIRWATFDNNKLKPTKKKQSLVGRSFDVKTILNLFNSLANYRRERGLSEYSILHQKEFDDKHISLTNGFIVDKETDTDLNNDIWNESLLFDELTRVDETTGWSAVIIESEGQRGARQFLSKNKYQWRDVFIYNQEEMLIRSFTKDQNFVPSVKEDFLNQWRMSNNMPEIPNQCLREFIYYLAWKDFSNRKTTLEQISHNWGISREKVRQRFRDNLLVNGVDHPNE